MSFGLDTLIYTPASVGASHGSIAFAPPIDAEADRGCGRERMMRMDDDMAFDRWMRELNEDVIQGEYGYEEGEFTAYPEMWHSLYVEGLAPSAAFKRALDAYGRAREEEERQKAENRARIQAENAALSGLQEGEMAERWRLVYVERDTGVRVTQYWESAEQAERECRLIEMRGDRLIECVPEQVASPPSPRG